MGVLYMVEQVLISLIEDLSTPIDPLPAAAKESVPKQIVDQGLTFEDFEITTEDGYILNIWHV